MQSTVKIKNHCSGRSIFRVNSKGLSRISKRKGHQVKLMENYRPIIKSDVDLLCDCKVDHCYVKQRR
jgi:hypothetical protein